MPVVLLTGKLGILIINIAVSPVLLTRRENKYFLYKFNYGKTPSLVLYDVINSLRMNLYL